MAQTHESQLEQLQAELEDLRRKSERRSFKQVMKDGYNKARKAVDRVPLSDKTEDWIIAMFVVISGVLLTIGSLTALIFAAAYTNGLVLLLLPIYPLYLIFRKEQ